MKIKGTALLSRKRYVVEQLGARAWDDFVAKHKQALPFLGQLVLANMQIEYDEFLKFQERLTGELFRNDPASYWRMGKASANWSMVDGPYKNLMGSKKIEDVCAVVPRIWRSFYTEAAAELQLLPGGNHARFTVKDLPRSHAFFELVPAGFVHQMIEIAMGHPVQYRRVPEYSSETSYCYEYGPLK